MMRASVILALLAAAPAAAKGPEWMDGTRLRWELAAGGNIGADFGGGPALAGLAVRGGALLSIAIGDDKVSEYAILQTTFGNSWGADLRLTTLGSPRGPMTFAAGLAVTATHALILEDWRARLRVPSVLGLVMPEVGLATRPGLDSAVYTAWSAPFAVLLTDSLGLEVTPRAFVVYGARTETIGLVSLTLVRQPSRHDTRDERDERDEGPPIPPQRTPVYAVHPSTPDRVVIDIESGRARHDIAFVRERSPVAATLRAVTFDERHAYAVGDGGVIVERGPRSSWRLEASGTPRNLRAIARALDGFVAVGDGGTIVHKGDRAKAWRTLPSPTQRDLLAVSERFISGARGVLLTWVDGKWRSIDTGVEEDLHAVWDCSYNERVNGQTTYHHAVCAAGQRGRLLRCTVDPLSVDCAPQPSPTTSDLYAATSWPYIFGAGGVVLQGQRSDPFDYTLAATLPTGDIYAQAENHWGPQIDGDGGMAEDALAVGARGAVVHWTRGRFAAPVILDPGIDLFGVATEELDWFVVGTGGAIFHGVTEHVAIWPTIELRGR
jgi:hypothetical protein